MSLIGFVAVSFTLFNTKMIPFPLFINLNLGLCMYTGKRCIDVQLGTRQHWRDSVTMFSG